MAVADNIEKLMRDFLWSGVGKSRKDHLVSWDVCCKPKKEGGLGLGILFLRTNHWQLSGFGAFLYILILYGTKSFEVSMVCTRMVGTPNPQVE